MDRTQVQVLRFAQILFLVFTTTQWVGHYHYHDHSFMDKDTEAGVLRSLLSDSRTTFLINICVLLTSKKWVYGQKPIGKLITLSLTHCSQPCLNLHVSLHYFEDMNSPGIDPFPSYSSSVSFAWNSPQVPDPRPPVGSQSGPHLPPPSNTQTARTNPKPGVFPSQVCLHEHPWGEVTNAVFFQFCPLLDHWNDLFLLSESVIVCYI